MTEAFAVAPYRTAHAWANAIRLPPVSRTPLTGADVLATPVPAVVRRPATDPADVHLARLRALAAIGDTSAVAVVQARPDPAEDVAPLS